ncbi:MAG TPA: hypothetical protein VHI78_08015 [Bacteroidales bacterium]|nr:hypothetical protein [Bacteroidales bacterium]
MYQNRFFLILLIFILTASIIKAQPEFRVDSNEDYQTLINGRIWRKKQPGISGDPFLFSNRYLDGSVSIGKTTFTSLKLRYDIFTDEIMIPHDSIVLQLNKERVDSFSVLWENRKIRFLRIPHTSLYPFSGYVRNVYTGKSSLYIKYQKKIDHPGIVNVPDNFYQIQEIYFLKDGIAYKVNNRKELLRILKNDRAEISAFLKENKVHMRRNDPEGFIPVLRFYDQIRL